MVFMFISTENEFFTNVEIISANYALGNKKNTSVTISSLHAFY